ncbi:hypothetical protein [Pseudoduganella chitinolytica]|uniref:SH3 domain-containing protein n=1 Tax=Pseudoduganella chitinolytica TaxID=34070 RepID=A0ABY8BF69_9BURK|nr:hypothetical protein [Pseudoduganella chitinolytica]WEF34560.1 hypothetical protein PX653_07285 [Pseudoduganella chitinolytica]
MLLPAVLALAMAAAHAGVTGNTYTNFGNDLVAPIFPIDGTLKLYRNKTDAAPVTVLHGQPAIFLEKDVRACVQVPADGWVRCATTQGTGWVRRSTFRAGADMAAPATWPFRYWLYVASDGRGAEESTAVEDAAARNPYLVKAKGYEHVYFHVRFDAAGNAIGPKTGKPTGERAFVVDGAVYLAPGDPAKRNGARWLFLNYYHEKPVALCPGREPVSCLAVVNVSEDWQGMRTLLAEPPNSYADPEGKWAFRGATEVAFARHADPVQPLLYQVTDDVWMPGDNEDGSPAARQRRRARPFCIADCAQGGPR